ncbi:MAG: family 10 glycosylhydrolase [Proteobacteria bacterium]|nr:family 10 glycosylhydrolase [Pseudomonadota bacterium]
MIKRYSLLLCAWLVMVVCSHKPLLGQSKDFVLPRGLWVSNVGSDVFQSYRNMLSAIYAAKQLGVDSLFPVIWNKQDFFFNSKTVIQRLSPSYIRRTRYNEDVLEVMIQAARDNNLKIYPSFESGLRVVLGSENSDYTTSIGQKFLDQDNWLSLDKYGNVYQECYFRVCFGFINILNPEVRDLLFSLVKDLITSYDIDGLIFDDHFSLPRTTLGCDPSTDAYYDEESVYRNLLKSTQKITPLGIVKHLTDRLCDIDADQWRRQAITQFIADSKALAERYGKKIILAPAGLPKWSQDEWLLDWEEMVRKDVVDGVIMQAFRSSSFSKMINNPYLKKLSREKPDVPIGVVILLGLRNDHYYAHGERVYRQTLESLRSGREPSYYYHETVDLPVEGYSLEYRREWIERTRRLLVTQPPSL